jgi:hypothetical protein
MVEEPGKGVIFLTLPNPRMELTLLSLAVYKVGRV